MARFLVNFRVSGRASDCIEADNLDDAERIIEERVNNDNFDVDLEEVDDVDFTVAQLHPVTRNGREIWTTLILVNDVRGHQSALASAPLFSGLPEEV